MPGFPTSDTDKGLRVGVIRTRWGGEMVDALHEQVVAGLAGAGVEGESLVEMTVPGAFEVPMAARLMGLAQKVDAIVVVGLLVQGETGHYEYISKAVTGALMEVSRGGRAAGGLWFGMDAPRWESERPGAYMPMPSLLTCLLGTGLLLRLLLLLFCFPTCFFCPPLTMHLQLQLISSIPIVNGILTCTSTEQAAERTTGPKSQAKAWAEAAVEMGGLRSSQVGAKSRTTNKKPSVGFF